MNKQERITFRSDETLEYKIDKLKEITGLNTSQLMRLLINQEFNKRKGE